MSKVIGLITAWAAEPFIKPAIDQALEYCDEVIVSVSANDKSFNKFEDNTMDICKSYGNKISMVKGVELSNHISSKGSSLKKMLDETGNNKKGNWIWILDADEFYFKDDVNQIRSLINEGKVNAINTKEKFFLIDTKNHVKWQRTRIKKLLQDNTRFKTNQLPYEHLLKPHKLDSPHAMHHYSFLMNPHFKRQFWLKERSDSNAPDVKAKIWWMDNIYLKMDLNKMDYWVNVAEKKFGNKSILGPIFNKKATNNGGLYTHDTINPEFIAGTSLEKIKDFRKLY